MDPIRHGDKVHSSPDLGGIGPPTRDDEEIVTDLTGLIGEALVYGYPLEADLDEVVLRTAPDPSSRLNPTSARQFDDGGSSGGARRLPGCRPGLG
jgi:hypothetical protein